MEEQVVLVDEQNNVLGSTPKRTVHTTNTPLHRGFSLFVFNSQGEFLLTQRALSKKTFPGVWTNSVCGHPALHEDPQDSAVRRLKQEMGMTIQNIEKVSDYQYRCADNNGIVENEICPVYMGVSDDAPQPQKDEVEAWKWIGWEEFLADINKEPEKYSLWCREEAFLVKKHKRIENFFR